MLRRIAWLTIRLMVTRFRSAIALEMARLIVDRLRDEHLEMLQRYVLTEAKYRNNTPRNERVVPWD